MRKPMVKPQYMLSPRTPRHFRALGPAALALGLAISGSAVVAGLAGLAGPAGACSQCLCGNPTPAGFFLNSPLSTWSYGLEELYLAKSNALDTGPGEESQAEHRLAGQVAWRPAPRRLLLRLRVPYVFKANTRLSAATEPEARAGEARSHGLGDAELLARFDVAHFHQGLLHLPSGAFSIVAAAGVPTGSNDARDGGGQRLDAHLQPGTGAWSWTAGLALDRQAAAGAISGSALARFNGTGSHGYRYGNAVLLNAGHARVLGPSLEGALELNGRWADYDHTEEGPRDSNTGGAVLYLSPSLRWSVAESMALEAMAQLPVARRLHGIQNEKGTLRLALSWTPR